MAILGNTTSAGDVSANKIYHHASAATPWYLLSHCADATSTSICNPTYSCGWLHIRTPLPLELATGQGWNPGILEVVGHHTYSGEYTHDLKWVYNVNGYDGSWYGNQLKINKGNTGNSVMYRSNSTYGGYRRLCIALPKVGCCCVGYVWVRWWVNQGYYNNFPWATTAFNSSNAVY